MADVTYKPNYRGTGELMRTAEMKAMLEVKGREAQPIAQLLSPDAPPVGEGYRDSFGVAIEVHRLAGNDRAVAVLYNDSDHATAVEFGWSVEKGQWTDKPGYHVLSRTADLIGD